MNKIILSTVALLSMFSVHAQTSSGKKPLSLVTVSGGMDWANKTNFTSYVKSPLKGFNTGGSFTKYWNWLGAGVEINYLQNEKPVYDNTLLTAKLTPWTPPAVSATQSNTSNKLTRVFAGIGPSFKYQTNNNKFVAELNLLGGISFTNGSAVNTTTTSTGWPLLFTKTPFVHSGYSNDKIATGKAQVRLNYFFTEHVGAHLGGYYFLYWGAKERYDYYDLTVAPPYHALPLSPPLNGLSNLNSYGVFAGLSFKFGNASVNAGKKQKANSMITVMVKDELTGQPLTNATVNMTGAGGKSYSGITGTNGIVKIDNVVADSYVVTGLLNEIATTQQNVAIAKNDKTATATLIHNDPRFTVQGKAINLADSKPESGVSVTLKNAAKGSVKMATSQSVTGQFGFQLDANSDYELVGKKASYISNIEKITTKGLTRSQTLYVELELGVEEVVKGKPIQLNKIYYDMGKANITEAASSDLEKLVQFLTDNPTFKIEIASHTDNSIGSDEANMVLSQQRAAAVVKFLVQKGISSSRMSAKGYGVTRLKYNCGPGTNCTEDQHQANRRTEFNVTAN